MAGAFAEEENLCHAPATSSCDQRDYLCDDPECCDDGFPICPNPDHWTP